MKRPVEVKALVNEGGSTATSTVLLDLDDISFAAPYTWNHMVGPDRFTRLKFKGSAYVVVEMSYAQARDMILGSAVTSVMFEESSDEQRPQPVPAGPSPSANAHDA